MIAALFVEKGGGYFGLDDVDPWDEDRDARIYAGPWPVVAHPPCQRWGRFWHGSPRKPHQFELGDDKGCFAAALNAVRTWGGVLEHPADSHAWSRFDLNRPNRRCEWVVADWVGGWTCYVDQAHYGHVAAKPTWLYAAHVELPLMDMRRVEQRLNPVVLARHGYEVARRRGQVSLIGGKDKTAKRNATPQAFRDLLIGIARTSTKRRGGSIETASAASTPERRTA